MAIAGIAGGLAWLRMPTVAAGPTPWRAPVQERIRAPFPRAIDDGVVTAPPRRILAASILSAEVVLAVAPRERVAAVLGLATDARYSQCADAAASVARVEADPEAMVAATPDLVIVDEFSRAEVPLLLRAAGIAVIRTHSATNFDDVIDNIRIIGFALGCDAAAEQVVDTMRHRLGTLAVGAAEIADWRVMNLNGDLDTYGRRSLLDAAVRAAGARHLPAERGVGGYQKLDVETVLAWNPDALIIGVEPGSGEARAAWLHQYPGLNLLDCVRRDHVLYLPAALLGATSQHAPAVAEHIQQQLRAWGHP